MIRERRMNVSDIRKYLESFLNEERARRTVHSVHMKSVRGLFRIRADESDIGICRRHKLPSYHAGIFYALILLKRVANKPTARNAITFHTMMPEMNVVHVRTFSPTLVVVWSP